MNRLHNKCAIVTGGTRGIGRAICVALAKEGANVAFTYRENKDLGCLLVEELTALGVQAMAFQANVRDRLVIRNAFSTVMEAWGKLDILVNNAGINKPTDFDQVTDDDWDEILEVNLKGPFICCQEALPYLRKGEDASIIHIGSVSGQYGGPRTAHYAASKAGLISLSQVVARFCAKDGIRSNVVSAGLISSEMGATGMQAPSVAKAAESILLGRLGVPDEVAQAVIFLASDESKYITAQNINVNGGLYF
ncbi:MAG: 3-oxoacyl-ACP reductase FabG [Comamonadaceae bacterium]|nr:MAG: 3-oxoacyl-ACP reductase FabG [Comamonadaceae bacterium]